MKWDCVHFDCNPLLFFFFFLHFLLIEAEIHAPLFLQFGLCHCVSWYCSASETGSSVFIPPMSPLKGCFSSWITATAARTVCGWRLVPFYYV